MSNKTKRLEKWALTRRNGLAFYLIVNGVIVLGGLFATGMVIGGYFISANIESFGDYLFRWETLFKFAFHAAFFGLTMGTFGWYTNELAYNNDVARHPKMEDK